MSDASSAPSLADLHVIRTAQLDPAAGLHVSHPLNDRSELHMTRLSDPTGLRHLGISLARVPPGKESFSLHVHTQQEEWIYVISGSGHVQLDDERVPICAGDFVGFPPNGPAHLVCNSAAKGDLVYLQGGDRRDGDRGRFPTLGKVSYQHDDGHMAWVDEAAVEVLPFTAWLVDPPPA